MLDTLPTGRFDLAMHAVAYRLPSPWSALPIADRFAPSRERNISDHDAVTIVF